MAGRGSRLRPHTLTVPKPLVHVAGTIVHRLVEDIADMCEEKIEEISLLLVILVKRQKKSYYKWPISWEQQGQFITKKSHSEQPMRSLCRGEINRPGNCCVC